jgi:hypothetical protein
LPLLSLIHLAADAHAAAAGGAKREGPETIGVGGVPVDTSMFRTLDAVVERMLGGSSTTSSSSATSKEQSREYRTSGEECKRRCLRKHEHVRGMQLRSAIAVTMSEQSD